MHLVKKLAEPARDLAQLRALLGAALDAQVGFVVAVQDAQGQLLFHSDPVFVPPSATTAHAHTGLDHLRLGGQSFHVLRAPLQASGERAALTLSIGLSTAEHDHFMHGLWWQVGLYMLLAAALAGGLGWLAARQGLQPLRGLTARLQGVTAQRLHQSLPKDQVPDELAGLTEALNAMLRRLQADFERLSDFSADLAHELRTPLSNLLTQTQVALTHTRSPADYREVLASNAEEFERLARMVSDMLLLAKMEHGIELPHRERLALRPELEALFDFYEAWAEERGLSLKCEGDAQVQGDRLMLRRALSNMLSNALRYASTDSCVSVRIEQIAGQVHIAVRNAGPHIDPQDLPRLFDRFYRADAARQHAPADVAGLGLAITQAMARAHGGQVSVQSSGGWTTFTLVLPAAV
jgi:two-component system heavy metal sensor histidine kinase CusS